MLKRIIPLLFIGVINIANAKCITIPNDDQPNLQLTLTGYLMDETEWGPPNFGEDPQHDSQYKIVVLKLDTPMTICNPQDTATDLKTLDCIQIGNSCSTPLIPYTGQHVSISGNAFGASDAWHITPLVMLCQQYKFDNNAPLSTIALANLKNYRCQSTGGGAAANS